MQFGVHIFPTEHSIQPDELARAVEERGLDSLWFSEHTHIPVRFLNMPGRGSSLPDYYWQTYDIFVSMTLAAVATKKIKIATGISLVIERDPTSWQKKQQPSTFSRMGVSFLELERAGSSQKWLTTV